MEKIVKFFGVMLLLSTFLGCATSIPVDRQIGDVDTSYTFSNSEAKTGKKIIILSPQGYFQKKQREQGIPNTQNPFALMAAMKAQNNGPDHSVYYASKIDKVRRSYDTAFEKLITNKGFTFSGPYASFEQVPYRDKKESYLALEPTFEFSITPLHVKRDNLTSFTRETGELSAQGQVKIKLIEPLSKQVMFVKIIDVDSLGIKEAYTIERELPVGQNGGLIAKAFDGAIKNAAKPEVLLDNADLAYSKVLTSFYKKVVENMNVFISREEMLSYSQDIDDLKDRKRF